MTTVTAEYQRNRRATSQKARDYDRAYHRARNRALAQLAAEYPARFDELLASWRKRDPILAPVTHVDNPWAQAYRRAVLARGGRG